MIKLNLKLQMEGLMLFRSKITNTYKFLNKIEREKYYNSLKILTEFQIKNFETEFEKCNKKLLELENSRITLVDAYLRRKKEILNIL